MTTRPCERCKGEKQIPYLGDPGRMRECYACSGRGEFPEINEGDARQRILASKGKGKNKGKIRATMTAPFGGNVEEARAYYVWRLARFNGGKDVTMPCSADLILRGDPFKKELDELADQVAKEQFGTDMAAAFRWGRAFGIL